MFLTWGELLSISLLGDYVYACVGERGFAAERSGNAAAMRRPNFAL